MREHDPEKGEPIHGIRPRGKVCSLHVGQGRAVTTWDEEEDVCWLLAWHWFHRNGHPDDCYNLFLALHNNGDKLLPTQEDYESFLDSSDADEDDFDGVMRLDLLDELAAMSRELLDEARAHPNVEAIRTFRVNGHQIMCVDALVEEDGRFEDGWISLRLPEDEHLSDLDVYDLLVSVLPEGVMPLYETKFRGRERMPGEIVYHWEHWELHL